MRTLRLSGIALVGVVIGCATTVHQGDPAPQPAPVRAEPRIHLWMTGDRMVRRGDDVRLTFRATESGYAMVGRIDTDGRLQVLWPRTPGESDHVWANRTYEVRRYGDRAFSVDDRSGTGYVFAVVSERPIASLRWARNFHWDHDALGSPVRGDPYVAMHRLAERVVGDPDSYYDLAYLEYHVDRRYAYPRFVCYDCHYGPRSSVYDAYDHPCVKYRVVVYDDPDYYPYRSGGRRVVYARPRYEFKPVAANEPVGTIEYRRRTGTVDRRRAGRPTDDPNLPPPDGGGAGNPGATRPGDDDAGRPARDPRDDRRGGQGQGQATGRERNRPPVWEQPAAPGSGSGGQGNGGNGNAGSGNGCNGVGNPCNGNNGNGNSGNNGNAGGSGNPGNGGNGNPGNGGNGNPGNGGNGNPGNGGSGSVRQPATQPDDRRDPGRFERPRVESPRGDRPSRGEPPPEEPRRVAPPRDESPAPERPREEPRREEARRDEPRREEPRREEPRRVERPREEPRRAEPERREQPKPAARPAPSRPREPEPRRRP